MKTQFKVSVESTIYTRTFVFPYSSYDEAVDKFKTELLEHANMSSLFDMITTIELKRLAIYDLPDTTLKTITLNSLIQVRA